MVLVPAEETEPDVVRPDRHIPAVDKRAVVGKIMSKVLILRKVTADEAKAVDSDDDEIEPPGIDQKTLDEIVFKITVVTASKTKKKQLPLPPDLNFQHLPLILTQRMRNSASSADAGEIKELARNLKVAVCVGCNEYDRELPDGTDLKNCTMCMLYYVHGIIRLVMNAEELGKDFDSDPEGDDDQEDGYHNTYWDEVTASQYSEYPVWKVRGNEPDRLATYLKKDADQRLLGIDRKKVYTLYPRHIKKAFSGTLDRKSQHAEHDVATVQDVVLVPPDGLEIHYCDTREFQVFKTKGKSDAAQIKSKLQYLQTITGQAARGPGTPVRRRR